MNICSLQPIDSSAQEEMITKVVDILCSKESYEEVGHHCAHQTPMPSIETLQHIMEDLRSILFPGYFGPTDFAPQSMRYYVGSSLDRVFRALREQIKRGLCFACQAEELGNCQACEQKSARLASEFLARLPHIRKMLAGDVDAAYEGDPATNHKGETIFCYPSIHALTYQRVAHELHKLAVPLIPRIMTEMAHSATGIDIHPGAQIGERMFMDHGTGVVIGETTIIGKNVRIYQGVTLGAKSFPKDANGNPIKGIPRHPIIEDEVTIYAGATILGRITIGKGSVIGGNVWVIKDLPPKSRVVQGRYEQSAFENGGGI